MKVAIFLVSVFALVGVVFSVDCDDEEFECVMLGTCIPERRICDGWYDCPDGTDEQGCTSPPTTPSTPSTTPACRGDEYRCKDGHCISQWWLCDGIKDCKDGDDEADCAYTTTGCPGFLCKEKKCITDDWVCDGDFDCKDGEDEENCD